MPVTRVNFSGAAGHVIDRVLIIGRAEEVGQLLPGTSRMDQLLSFCDTRFTSWT